jgi:hypothetical protein
MKCLELSPKEKAIKLLKQFEAYTPHGFEYYYSKECALLVLDDILNEVESEEKKSFWKKTKEELKKL